MIGCLWISVRKQPIIALYFESENKIKFYNSRPGLKKKTSYMKKSVLISQLQHVKNRLKDVIFIK